MAISDLTGQRTSKSFKNLLQISSSGALYDGTGSLVTYIIASSSYAATASYALNGGSGAGFPYTGSAGISGSIIVTGSVSATQGGFTGSLQGSASYATTASFAVSASYINTLNQTVIITGSAKITGSLNVSQGITGSLFGTSSFALNSETLNGTGSGAFATTGSNLFYGNQTISASSSNTSALDIHVENDGLWTFRTYNDVYSTSSIGLASWIADDGISFLGTETDRPLYVYNDANYYSPSLIVSSSGVTVNNNLTVNNDTTTPTINTHQINPISGQDLYVQIPMSRSLDMWTDDNGGELILNAQGLYIQTNATQNTWLFDKQGVLTAPGGIAAPSFTGSLFGTASWSGNSISASYALSASFVNALKQNVIITGSLNLFGNLNVIGTASFIYSSASVVSVGTNIITLNTDNPASRFGGITVIDSGSFGNSSTGSLFWDSQNNRWVYANPSGSTYDGGMLISGPRNTSGLGNESGMNANFVAVGQGEDHIQPSTIYNSGSITIVTGSLTVTQGITGSLQGTSSLAVSSSFATTAVTASFAPNYVLNSVTSSMLQPYVLSSSTSSFVTNSQTSSMLQPYVLSSSTGSFVVNSQTSSFITNSQTSSMSVATASFTQSGNGTFSGSFSGSGANLNSIPASAITGLNLAQIATGSVTASVTPTQFSVVSGSSTEFLVTGTGITIGSVITDTHKVTGSLNISGSITATSFTGSLQGTASYALTAGTGGTSLGLVQAFSIGLQNIF